MTSSVMRVTRAINDTDEGKRHEFILVQTHNDVTPLIRGIAEDKTFERRTVSGWGSGSGQT